MTSPTHAQFARLNMAGMKRMQPAVGKDKVWSDKDILAEAERLPKNSHHVANPSPPTWLKGSHDAVLMRSRAWRDQAREAGGKAKLRRNSPSLACAVVSWPKERQAEWEKYRDLVISYFRSRYGDRVCGVAEHLDEAHPHIHLFLVPRDGEGFGAVHPGYAARARSRAVGGKVFDDFKAAMRTWQDELFDATGRQSGLTRVGPKRMRLSRIEYVRQKKSKENAAQMNQAAEAALKAANDLLTSVRRREAELESRERAIEMKAALETRELHVEIATPAHSPAVAGAAVGNETRIADTRSYSDGEIRRLREAAVNVAGGPANLRSSKPRPR